MASINMVVIVGFVGDEPKINTTQNGRKMASFTVATTEKGYTSQQGVQYPDRTEWHSIIAWGKTAEVIERFIHKGSLVYVQGKLRTRSYEDKNQIKRYVTEIEVETLQMLDKKPSSLQEPVNVVQGKSENDDLPF